MCLFTYGLTPGVFNGVIRCQLIRVERLDRARCEFLVEFIFTKSVCNLELFVYLLESTKPVFTLFLICPSELLKVYL